MNVRRLTRMAILQRGGVKVWNQWRKDDPNIIPDLYDAKLDFAEYDYIQLNSTNLGFTSFRYAKLRNANFDGAGLCNSILSDADLSNSNFKGANLTRVQALGTNFENAILTGACIEEVIITRIFKAIIMIKFRMTINNLLENDSN